MFWILYNILFTIGYILLLPHFVARMLRRGGYRRNFGERFGRYAPEKIQALGVGRIWVHAVSVGEAQLALALIDVLRKEEPSLRFLISTTTSTGYAILEKRKHADDVQVYFPVDFPCNVRRVVDVVRPRAVILLECELWPNFLRCLSRADIPVWVVNGRISERSYQGYRKVRMFFSRAAECITTFLVQTEQDAARLHDLGAADVRVFGSAKFDLPLPDEQALAVASKAVADAGMDEQGLFWVMGSTWPGEEKELLKVFQVLRKTYADLQAIVVPRHAERGGAVEDVLRDSGLPYVRRSKMSSGGGHGKPVVLLADTTGELAGYYMLADLVYIGKSMAGNHGGQNPVEPAALGKAVLTGKYMENFPGVMVDLKAADAIITVSDFVDLQTQCEQLLADTAYRTSLGARAKELVASRRGVMRRSAEFILSELRVSKR